MWNRSNPNPPTSTPSEAGSYPAAPVSRETRQKEVVQVNIGQSILIKGELTGNEDLTIDGRVEGSISLKDHHLTIGKNGRIQASIRAKSVKIDGTVNGNVQATERVEVAPSGSLTGDIVAPRIVIADGARFKGTVDMDSSETPATKGAAPFEAKHHAEKATGTA